MNIGWKETMSKAFQNEEKQQTTKNKIEKKMSMKGKKISIKCPSVKMSAFGLNLDDGILTFYNDAVTRKGRKK